jgi:hypothetical protein
VNRRELSVTGQGEETIKAAVIVRIIRLTGVAMDMTTEIPEMTDTMVITDSTSVVMRKAAKPIMAVAGITKTGSNSAKIFITNIKSI